MIFHSCVCLPEGIKGDFHCHVWWPECRFEHGEKPSHARNLVFFFRHQMTCNPDTRCICLCQVSIQLVIFISYMFSFLYIYNIISYTYIYIYIHTYTYLYLLLQMQSRYVQKIAIRKDSELIIIHTSLEFRTSSWCHQCWEMAFRAYSDGHLLVTTGDFNGIIH